MQLFMTVLMLRNPSIPNSECIEAALAQVTKVEDVNFHLLTLIIMMNWSGG